MQRLIKRNTTPPGGFRFHDVLASRTTRSPDLPSLIRDSIAFRKLNNLPVPDDFPEFIEDFLCGELPTGLCVNERGIVSEGVPYRSPTSAVNATYLMRRFMRDTDGTLVNADEAERRAVVCSHCVQNMSFAGCMSCKGIKDMIREMTGGREPKNIDELLVCNVNGCLNAVQIWIDSLTLNTLAKMEKGGYPEDCWKLKQCANARKEQHEKDRSGTGSLGGETRRWKNENRVAIVGQRRDRPADSLGHNGNRRKCGKCGKRSRK